MSEIVQDYWSDSVVVREEAKRTGTASLEYRLAWQDVLRRQLNPNKNSVGRKLKILDIGTKTGLMAMLMAQMRHQVTALDPSHSLLEVARQRSEEAKLTVRWEQSPLDLGEIDFPSGAFDAITIIDSLTRIPTPRQTLMAYLRVVKPGGRLIIITPSIDSKQARQNVFLYMNEKYGEGYHDTVENRPLYRADSAALTGLLTYTGWENVQQTKLGGQLIVEGKWKRKPYTVTYCAMMVERPGVIPLNVT